MATHLAMLLLLTLPWLDHRPVMCEPIDDIDQGLTVHQAVYPLGFRYREDLRTTITHLDAAVDLDARAKVSPLGCRSRENPPPLGNAGPRLLALLMSFQT